MFAVVIVVLSIVLAFNRAVYRWVDDPTWVWAAVGIATLLPPIVAAGFSRCALRRIEARPAHPADGQAVAARGMQIVLLLLAFAHVGLLMTTDWLATCYHLPIIGDWIMLPGMIATLPFLTAVILVWIAMFPADRAIREIGLELHLFRGRPVRPTWNMRQYLMFNLRHHVLFILVPMLIILAARDTIECYAEPLRAWIGHDFLPDVLLGAAAVIVALIAPLLFRHIWLTQRLPEGPLRERLLWLCDKLRMRCRDILVWKTQGMMVNAAVMGVIAPLRYVLISDGMLEEFDDEKVEAVFGHEAGHVKRQHIIFYLLFALISGCIVTIFSVRSRGLTEPEYQLVVTILGTLLAFKWFIVFTWISRRFERQADIFGVRTLALSGLPCQAPCALHGSEQNPAPRRGDPLCITAAHLFGNTLNDVAVLNGIRPEAWSWRHASIASRSRTLIKLAQDPQATARFERRMRYIKAAIFLGALLSSAGAVWELRLWRLLGIEF